MQEDTPLLRRLKWDALWKLVDGLTDGVISITCKPDDSALRIYVQDSLTDYLHRKLKEKKTKFQVNNAHTKLVNKTCKITICYTISFYYDNIKELVSCSSCQRLKNLKLK